ncbi:MAG TPA: YecA family protein [Usitatibacteraceae bacterium]
MSTAPASTPLSDAEIEHLEDLLASPVFAKQAMGLDEMQGFLAAVISGPDLIGPSLWMPAVLGNPQYLSAEQEKEVGDLVQRFYNEIAADLVEGETLGLLLQRDEGAAENDYDYETWCQAYLDGVDFSATPWEEAGDAEEINEMLFPIALLAGEIEPKVLKQIKPRDMAQLLLECREDLPLMVIEIHQYFLALRERPQPKSGRSGGAPKLH